MYCYEVVITKHLALYCVKIALQVTVLKGQIHLNYAIDLCTYPLEKSASKDEQNIVFSMVLHHSQKKH